MPNVSAFWALLLPRARRTPWVVHWQADVPVEAIHRGVRWFYRLYRPFEQWVLRRAKIIIATSPAYMYSSTPLAPFLQRCRVVPLGIKRQPTTPSSKTEPTKPTTPLRVIAVGRLTYYKGFDVLLRALAKCPDVTLEIVGEGERKQHLCTLIEQMQLGGRVKLLGNLSNTELGEHLCACDCLCLPSIERTEAFGVVLLEAMARSKPCVVTSVPGTGMSWEVEHNHTGLVVPPNDIKALEQMQTNRSLYKTMRKAGLKRFQDKFIIDKSATLTAKIYRELVDVEAH